MARVLAQTVRTLELVGSLRSRQELLERLAQIQRSIVQRTDLDAMLDAIVDGARELIGDEVVTLRLLDDVDPTVIRLVAAAGIAPETRAGISERRLPEGADLGAERVFVIEGDVRDPVLIAEGLTALMSAPVFRNGAACGLLTVATRTPDRHYGADERDVLITFAEHASLALTDARNHSDAVHRALHDPLTNLPNRSLFLDRLRQAEQRAERAETAVGVLFVDLDGFKTINDSLGHARGDELLIAVAKRLADTLRAGDTAARLGGDEFAVLLDGLDDEREAVLVAQRMLEALREPWQRAARASAVATARRGPGGDLLRDADLAMYQAKAQGRDRVVSFDCDDARGDAGRRRDGERPAPRARRRRAAPRLPADRRPRDRRPARRRGAAALAPPEPRHRPAGRLHPARRGDGPDRADRRAGCSRRRAASRPAGPTCPVIASTSPASSCARAEFPDDRRRGAARRRPARRSG